MNKEKENIEEIKIINDFKSNKIKFDYIYNKYENICKKSIRKKGADNDIIDDIYQETMNVFYKKIKSDEFKLTSKISTYLYSIASNLWLKEIEKRKRFVNTNTSELDFNDVEMFTLLNQEILKKLSYEDTYSEDDYRLTFLKKLSINLPPMQKKLLYLYLEDYTNDEIIEIMGYKNTDSLKTNKHKLFKNIKTKIKESY